MNEGKKFYIYIYIYRERGSISRITMSSLQYEISGRLTMAICNIEIFIYVYIYIYTYRYLYLYI